MVTESRCSSFAMFELMACNLRNVGYSIHYNSLPLLLGNKLWDQAHETPASSLIPAGIGRRNERITNLDVRNDAISWIDSDTTAGDAWIVWTDTLQQHLNEKLFLGLFSFESHFALYTPGGFYKRHQDAFAGDSNRILSLVLYLNRDWVALDAGELVLFTEPGPLASRLIKPEFGTLVVFLSEEVEHEVLVTTKDRHSIAGWFRGSNSSH